MADNFITTYTLPVAPNAVTAADLTEFVETINPLQAVADVNTIQVQSNQLKASLNVSRWFKTTKAHTDFQAASTSNDIELFLLPGAGVVEAYKIKASTAFAGTGITAYTISLGITGNLTKYAAAFDVFAAVSDTNFGSGTVSGGAETHAAGGTSIRAEAISTGANLDQSTAGSVDIWVKYSVTV